MNGAEISCVIEPARLLMDYLDCLGSLWEDMVRAGKMSRENEQGK
jgi:hypothetical protein